MNQIPWTMPSLQRKMHAKPELHGMENIFSQLVHEAKWTSKAKRIASNVWNAFRQEASQFIFNFISFTLLNITQIWDSIIGKKQCSAEQFMMDSCIRYQQGTKAGTFEQGYLIHNMILVWFQLWLLELYWPRHWQRRFASENKNILGIDEDEDLENEDPTDFDNNGDIPAKRQKRSTAKGRVAHSDDFWSRVDSWFKEKIESWGTDFSGVDWKAYVNLVHIHDISAQFTGLAMLMTHWTLIMKSSRLQKNLPQPLVQVLLIQQSTSPLPRHLHHHHILCPTVHLHWVSIVDLLENWGQFMVHKPILLTSCQPSSLFTSSLAQ